MAASQPTPLRQVRERELVQATRALFDERGLQDAPIEEIAKNVGIARGLIYRHFSSKEELYVLTVTDYLAELYGVLRAATSSTKAGPVAQLEQMADAYARFCLRYPAFLDCALSLMRRPARELQGVVSGSVWLRLGQGMATCVDQLAQLLRAGNEAGVFDVEDPDFMASALWTQILGLTHLARIGAGVRQRAYGVPELFEIDSEQIVRTVVHSAMATVGSR